MRTPTWSPAATRPAGLCRGRVHGLLGQVARPFLRMIDADVAAEGYTRPPPRVRRRLHRSVDRTVRSAELRTRSVSRLIETMSHV